MEKITDLQKDVLQIAQMVKNDGIEERVHSAQTSWLTWTASDKEIKRSVESLYENRLITLFYDMRKKLNRLATQDEYVDEYLNIAMAKIVKQDWYNKNNNEYFVEDCVIWRADRAYKSNSVEITTAYQLEQLGYSVFRELHIDYVAGVDLVAVKDNKVWYIHITKDSKWSRDKVLTKGTYKSYYVNRKAVNYQRNFEGHVELFYSNEGSHNNVVNNGLPLFKNDYLFSEIGNWNSFEWDSDNQVAKLMNSMKSAGAVYREYKWVSTDNKLEIK